MMKQQGLSLLELLISLLLSSFIVVLLSQTCINIKRDQLAVQRVYSRQYDLQFALQLLQNSIKQAGFTPCGSIRQLTTMDRRFEDKAIAFFQAGEKSSFGRMSSEFATEVEIENSQLLKLVNPPKFADKSPLIIADCFHAEIHWPKAVSRMGNTRLISLKKPLFFSYQAPIYLGEWQEEYFFIRKNTRANKALFYQYHRSEELTDEINGLQTRYENGVIRADIDLKNKEKLQWFTRMRLAP